MEHDTKKPTAGIVLAAGLSSRFGTAKQLALFRGRTLLERTVETAVSSLLDRVVVVLGHRAGQIRATHLIAFDHPKVDVIENPDFKDGMSTSVRMGLEHAARTHPSVMFLLGDQPLIRPDVIDRLLSRFWASDKDICVPVFQGKRGNPAIFGRAFFDEIRSLRGDTGARGIIDAYPDRVLPIEISNPALFIDVDCREDLLRLEGHLDDLTTSR